MLLFHVIKIRFNFSTQNSWRPMSLPRKSTRRSSSFRCVRISVMSPVYIILLRYSAIYWPFLFVVTPCSVLFRFWLRRSTPRFQSVYSRVFPTVMLIIYLSWKNTNIIYIFLNYWCIFFQLLILYLNILRCIKHFIDLQYLQAAVFYLCNTQS